MSHRKIDIQLNISHQIIINFLKHLMIHESIENLHHSDTSRKTINSDDHYIVRIAKCNTRIPLTKLHPKRINNISQQILYHRLHEAKIKK